MIIYSMAVRDQQAMIAELVPEQKRMS